jgi:hypothetical protein
MSMRKWVGDGPMRNAIVTALLVASAGPLSAQHAGWSYTVAVSGWFTGLESDVDTRFGTIGTDLDFSDVWDKLNLALFGSFEARNGRWTLVADLVYSDLGSQENGPFGVIFRRAEVDARLALLSGYAVYAVVDEPGFRVEVGPALRYGTADIDVTLVGNIAPTQRFSLSDRWVDPLIAARTQRDIAGSWYATAVADVGGFGIGSASDITWQAYAGLGYRFNETWSVQAGYRTMTIERDIDGRDVTLGLDGIMVGTRLSF